MNRFIFFFIICFPCLFGCARGPMAEFVGGEDREHFDGQGGPACATIFLDPRAGLYMDNGIRLSLSEQIRMHFPLIGFLLTPVHMFQAGTGVTETEYRYNNGLDSLAGKANIELARYLYKKGRLKKNDFIKIINYIISHYKYPHPYFFRYVDFLNLPKMNNNRFSNYLYHWPDLSGPTEEELRPLLENNLITIDEIYKYLHIILNKNIRTIPPQPNYLILAEKIGFFTYDEMEKQLLTRFWIIYDWAINARELGKEYKFSDKYDYPAGSFTLEKALIDLYLNKN